MKKIVIITTFMLLLFGFGCSLDQDDETAAGLPGEFSSTDSVTQDTRAAGDPYSLITVAADYPVVLKHLQYRDGIWSWSTWKANPSFPGYSYFLNGNSASNWNDRITQHIFVAEIWAPAPANVENIVFLSAGQQGALIDRQDYPAIVTGQQESWHANSGINGWVYLKDKNLNISWKSVAGQIIADASLNNSDYFGFNSSNTYLALVFDACFYYEISSSEKNTVLNSWLSWMMSKCGNNSAGKLTTLYLAGASRGGALVTRMAYELRHNTTWTTMAKNARIIVSDFDAVANESEGELFSRSDWLVLNPDNIGMAFYTTFTANLLNTKNLHILQIAGGQEVTFLSSARAFYLHNSGDVVNFRWVSRSHTDIGRNWNTDTSEAQLQWLNQHRVPSLTNVNINGQTSNPVKISVSNPSVYLNGTSSHTHKFFVSVTPCDQYWNITGTEVSEWFISPNGFDVINYDVQAFCARKGVTLARGNYYRVKLATGNTWIEKTTCILMC